MWCVQMKVEHHIKGNFWKIVFKDDPGSVEAWNARAFQVNPEDLRPPYCSSDIDRFLHLEEIFFAIGCK